MFESALGALRLLHSLAGMDLRRRYRASLCRVSAQQPLCSWTISPCACALGIAFNSTTVLSTCLKSSCLKRGLLRAGTLRLEVRRIRLGASRDRSRGVVRLDFMAPHLHLVVDVRVTSARTNTNAPRIGARLPFLPLTLAPCALTVMSVCNILFFDLRLFRFGVLGGSAT
jgi:hypothetical protein